MEQAKWLSEEALQKAEIRREAKGEKEGGWDDECRYEQAYGPKDN